MRRLVILGAALAAASAVLVVAQFSDSSAPSTSADLGGNQSDSVNFFLPGAQTQNQNESPGFDVVYCGVRAMSEPYILDVVASNPPRHTNPEDPQSPLSPSHDGAGWLNLNLQNGQNNVFNVPSNASFAFSLSLGGVPGTDQIVQIWTKQAGNESGSGASFSGLASVLAQKGARDPFDGDGRNDNFCLSLGPAEGEGPPEGFRPGEFTAGQISTALPVPDAWVSDCNGADGGVLLHPGGSSPPCSP